MSFKFPLYPNHHLPKNRDERCLLNVNQGKSEEFEGLNTWLDLQERELCIIYMKEETPPFSKPLPDRIPQQQQWLYLSCSLSNYSLLHQPVR